MIRNSFRTNDDVASIKNSITRRIDALARAHDVLTQSSASSISIENLIDSAIKWLPNDRLSTSGPSLTLTDQAATYLSLIVHELATNAIKYGSISSNTGGVSIEWGVELECGVEKFTFCWKEYGGPKVKPPKENGGFGSRLLKFGIIGSANNDIKHVFHPDGIRYAISSDLSSVLSKAAAS